MQIISKGQTQCGSTFNPQVIQTSDPSRYNRYIQLEQQIANYISSLNTGNSTERLITPTSTITIPVVVHVLHNGEPVGVGNNISDAQVQSQIAVLNEDFRRLNVDRVNTPAAFAGIASDPNVEFRLACIDPNGIATNGIHRVQTNVNAFTYQTNANGSVNEQATGIKFAAQGGTDAWPTDRYLNIWVCNIAPFIGGGQLLGYSQFPFDYAVSPNTDGVVILNTAFGRVGNLRFQYDRGRTTTHEVGHWLDLFHIWGDDGTACTGSDQCGDTPNQAGANQSNCPGFPHVSCTNGPNGDMFMNYMDYTVDGCKNIYTQGQVNRMRAIFAQGVPRAAFIDNYFRINQAVGNNIFINNTTSLTVINPMCLPVTWGINGSATIISGQGTNTITVQGQSNGPATITATSIGYTDSKTIYVGLPAQPGPITFILIDPALGKIQAQVDPVPNATSYNWYKNGVLQTIGHGSFIQFPIARNVCDVYYDISVEAINSCGTSLRTHGEAYVPPCNNAFAISPNPASASINVAPAAGNAQLSANTTIDEIRIYDLQGNLKRYQRFNKSTSATMNIQGLINGSYFVEIISGTIKEKHQLVIQN
ncbi:MAG TPA: M43 family zinc metalloprotease [Hanamia sp.]